MHPFPVGLAILLLLGIGAGLLAPSAAPRAQSLAVWQWSSGTGDPADTARWQALGATDLLVWRGTVSAGSAGPRLDTHGQRRGGPGLARTWAVVRIAPEAVRVLGTPGGEPVASAALTALMPDDAGLQIDWDVPTRQLPAYGAWLRALRARLPAGCGLSCTGLLTWLHAESGLRQVVSAVDWWAPQAYATGLPPDPAAAMRLIGSDAVPAVLRQCAAMGAPFRLGLATYDQTSLWDEHGRLLAASLPLHIEDLLAAVGEPTVLRREPELLLSWAVPAATLVEDRILPAGSRVVAGRPTVAGLAADLAAVRAAGGTSCLGPAFFRLATPGEQPCLSTEQIAAAWQGAPQVAPHLIPVLEVTAAGWRLTLSNVGTSDWCAFSTPGVVALSGAGEPLRVPGGITVRAALGGVACAPGRADGVRVAVSFLRAGGSVRLSGPLRSGQPCRLLTGIPQAEE